MNSDFDTDPLDEFEDDSYEYISYDQEIQQVIGPKVKEYLAHYYGNRLGQLEAKTFLELENTIKEGFIEADMIPDLLYRNRNIPHDEFDAAYDAYTPSNKTFTWPRPVYWFDKVYSTDDEDEDTFLEDSDPMDLTEEQRKAKKIIEHIDMMEEDHAAFADFVKKGFDFLSLQLQQYLVKTAPLDFDLLTQDGFEALQECIFSMLSQQLEAIYEVVETDLRNKK